MGWMGEKEGIVACLAGAFLPLFLYVDAGRQCSWLAGWIGRPEDHDREPGVTLRITHTSHIPTRPSAYKHRVQSSFLQPRNSFVCLPDSGFIFIPTSLPMCLGNMLHLP